MSELKAFESERIYWSEEQVDNLRLDDNLFYLKSEADKVIAELIEKNKRLARKDLIMASETIKEVFKELHYQKYKRCRAMAKRCRDVWMLLQHFRRYPEKVIFYWRWWNIWLELAEKFEEEK